MAAKVLTVANVQGRATCSGEVDAGVSPRWKELCDES